MDVLTDGHTHIQDMYRQDRHTQQEKQINKNKQTGQVVAYKQTEIGQMKLSDVDKDTRKYVKLSHTETSR